MAGERTKEIDQENLRMKFFSIKRKNLLYEFRPFRFSLKSPAIGSFKFEN